MHLRGRVPSAPPTQQSYLISTHVEDLWHAYTHIISFIVPHGHTTNDPPAISCSAPVQPVDHPTRTHFTSVARNCRSIEYAICDLELTTSAQCPSSIKFERTFRRLLRPRVGRPSNFLATYPTRSVQTCSSAFILRYDFDPWLYGMAFIVAGAAELRPQVVTPTVFLDHRSIRLGIGESVMTFGLCAKVVNGTVEYVLRAALSGPLNVDTLLKLTYYSPGPVTLRNRTRAFMARCFPAHKRVPQRARKAQKHKATTNRQEIVIL
ncbi:hypothetical protein EDD17DRAFT_1840552 [Pisolithus thermaeus]|nr:hypothetical protein EDD17DRAFT_1840552 [Pisolithus thermaeus]